jgi:hypothetical protein
VGTFNNPDLFAGFPCSGHRAVYINVPEPFSIALLSLGGFALLTRRRESIKKAGCEWLLQFA